MFSADFYPTPAEVIARMVNGNDLTGKTVLEPSAGAGHILEYVAGLGATTVACENNKELSFITKFKCDRWLKEDFLEVEKDEVSHIHNIIMNPPFSADTEHILHAWKIAPEGCEIVALCNIESLDRRHTRTRMQLKNIVDTYGFYENIGEAFTNAERKTNVTVALVRLYKPGTSDSFEGYFDDEEDEREEQQIGLLQYNEIRDVVNRYVGACKLFEEVADNAIKMNNMIGEFSPSGLTFTLKQDDKPKSMEAFKIDLQKKAWTWIFRKMNMERFVTQKLKEDLNRVAEQQQKIPFTMRNIYKMMDMVAQTHGQRMKAAIVQVFETLTTHHHDNRYHVEGWKTNSHYLVDKKFIFPYIVTIDEFRSGNCFLKIRD